MATLKMSRVGKQEGGAMYKHILIPTDGSALSAAVARQGVTFAKSIHAKVTGITVSPSYHTFAVTPVMVDQ